MVQYHDPVRMDNGGEPVGNDDQRFPLYQPVDRSLDHCLVLWVSEGGGLVQHHHRAVLQNSTGDGNALPLAPGETASAVSHQGIIALWQSRNEVMAAGQFCSGKDFLVCGVRPPQPDVFFHRQVEQKIVL